MKQYFVAQNSNGFFIGKTKAEADIFINFKDITILYSTLSEFGYTYYVPKRFSTPIEAVFEGLIIC